MAGFRITGGKGFHMTFANGWSISVQWGPGNYCENQHNGRLISHAKIGYSEDGERGSVDAEIAVINPAGELIDAGGWGDTVRGWQHPESVLEWMNWTTAQPGKE